MSMKMKFRRNMTVGEALQLIYKKARRLDPNATWKIWLGAPKNIWAETDHTLQQVSRVV